MNVVITAMLFVTLSSFSAFRATQLGKLTVTVTSLRNDRGEVEIQLFNKADGFPSENTKAYKTVRNKITNGSCAVSFDGVPYGQYAVGVYHDENNNAKLDETWYGMPKEGVGVSTNPSLGIFSPPKFEKAKFLFNAADIAISIRLNYL